MEPLEPEPIQTPRQRALGCGALVAVFVLSVCGYFWWAWTIPAWEPPERVLPEPNTWDEYVPAAKALQTASIQWRQAHHPNDYLGPYSADFPAEDRRMWVAHVRPHLDALRAAFKLECVVPLDYRHPEKPYSTYLTPLREVARMFQAEGMLAVAEGRWRDAAQSYLDNMEMASDVGRDTPLLIAMTAESMDAMGRARLEFAADRLDAEAARVILTRLTRIDAQWGTLQDCLRQEQARSLMIAQAMGPAVGRSFQAGWRRPEHRWRRWKDAATFVVYPRGRFFRQRFRAYEDLIVWSEQPYPDRGPAPVPSDPVVADYVVTRPQFYSRWERTRNAHSLFRLMLALRIYRLEEGVYPSGLVELEPILCTPLPLDPFANAPYRYERTEMGYRLWSVGPDAVDDEGDIAIDRYKWQSNIPSGDIVIERPTTRG